MTHLVAGAVISLHSLQVSIDSIRASSVGGLGSVSSVPAAHAAAAAAAVEAQSLATQAAQAHQLAQQAADVSIHLFITTRHITRPQFRTSSKYPVHMLSSMLGSLHNAFLHAHISCAVLSAHIPSSRHPPCARRHMHRQRRRPKPWPVKPMQRRRCNRCTTAEACRICR